jgi:hypothetical protein
MGGIKIEATGKASIPIYQDNTSTNFNINTLVATTRQTLFPNANVTLQDTGALSLTTGTFQVWMSINGNNFPGGFTTVNILPNAFLVNNAIITRKNATFHADVMEVDFNVLAFVGS